MKEEKKGGDKRWCYVPNPDRKKVQLFSEALHMPEPLTTILMQRGITTFESARAFFNPSWDQMHDPFAMKGMEKAVSRVGKAVDDAELICIYGDYDVDGVTSVALLYSALQEVGAHVIYYLPDRHKEGYGLSEKGMTYCIAQGVKLVIAIDCGTRAIHPIQQAKEAGMDVIVCDHHEPGKVLPATVAMLNPKQAGCPYPFKELSGCGIG